MARIEYKTGDLLGAPERFLLHGCNARGVMGSGVAKLIRQRWPRAYEDYRKAFEEDGLRTGQVIWVDVGDKVVANAITQPTYGRSGVHLDYEALRAVMREVEAAADGVSDSEGRDLGPVTAIAMPLIGAGLGGGDWRRIAAIIEEELDRVQPVVYTIDGRIP